MVCAFIDHDQAGCRQNKQSLVHIRQDSHVSHLTEVNSSSRVLKSKYQGERAIEIWTIHPCHFHSTWQYQVHELLPLCVNMQYISHRRTRTVVHARASPNDRPSRVEVFEAIPQQLMEYYVSLHDIIFNPLISQQYGVEPFHFFVCTWQLRFELAREPLVDIYSRRGCCCPNSCFALR